MELLFEEWSDKLREIRPVVNNIFFKGNINLLFDDSPKLAVVGSRRMSDYGRKMIEKWMPVLTGKGVVIVSGFMYGVDMTAHRACVNCGGKTIAVLGWGIDRRLGKEDRMIYQEIIDGGGLVMSEWPAETPGKRWTFPMRNRIVVGLSDAVWVVEGAIKSGSMRSADLALKKKKPVLALPGQVDSEVSCGVNDMMKQGKAQMATSVDDLLAVLAKDYGQLKMNIE